MTNKLMSFNHEAAKMVETRAMKRKKAKSSKSKHLGHPRAQNLLKSNQQSTFNKFKTRSGLLKLRKAQNLENTLVLLLSLTLVSFLLSLLGHHIVTISLKQSKIVSWDTSASFQLFSDPEFILDLNSFSNDLIYWHNPSKQGKDLIFAPKPHPITWRIISNKPNFYENLVRAFRNGFKDQKGSKGDILEILDIDIVNNDLESLLKIVKDNLFNVTQDKVKIFLISNFTKKHLKSLHQLKSIIDSDVYYKGIGFIFYSFTVTCKETINFETNFLSRLSLNSTVCAD